MRSIGILTMLAEIGVDKPILNSILSLVLVFFIVKVASTIIRVLCVIGIIYFILTSFVDIGSILGCMFI